ncbi:MAG TPA: hypothetical protein PLE45_11320 [Spirochaetota bacterium]|nr:hypothetical protein [Spirochaetota bacterium]HOL57741.1 hypothetical protein [Spirochaetota bacterium]HPP05340.1 hypothetical protein [Spirochaetota bacterium]
MLRIIDANINRICEGLRVIEEVMRFEFNDSYFSKSLKEIRHSIRKKFNSIDYLIERDSLNDCGKNSDKIEEKRDSLFDILKANFLRVEEGLRVIEESIKLEKRFFENLSMIKSVRFKIYDLEKNIILKYFTFNRLKNYGIIKILNERDVIFNSIKENNLSAIQLESGKNNIDILNNIIDFCKKNEILTFIKNNLELAIILKSDGIVIDEGYYSFSMIRKNYKKIIGYIVDKGDIPLDADFFIIKDIKSIPVLMNKNKILLVSENDYEMIDKNFREIVNKYKII